MLKIKSTIVNLVSIISYFFLKSISIFINFRFLMIETSAIGHMSEAIEIHLLEKKKMQTRKNTIDMLDGNSSIIS